MTLIRLSYDASSPRRPVDLPTFRVVDLDPRGRWAVVDVPDDDVPPQLRDDPHVHHRPGQRPARASKARSRKLAAWHAHLDERYQEHAGRFRPIPK